MNDAQITAILGPTASGKSALAIKMAQEKNAHIISADALQVYKGLDICTAKTPIEERADIPHHLIDIKEISEYYSVAEFIQRTQSIIDELKKDEIPVIICGGTALYQMAFLYDYQFPKHAKSRPKDLEDQYHTLSNTELWEQLQKVDPERAQAIHPNNRVRLLRALDIEKMTQSHYAEQVSKREYIRPDVDVHLFLPDRDTLYQHINQRVDQMMDLGWIEEAKQLFEHYPINSPGFKAIGYPEIHAYLHGKMDYEACVEKIKQKTRHFAKRQYTWYRKLEAHETIQLL